MDEEQIKMITQGLTDLRMKVEDLGRKMGAPQVTPQEPDLTIDDFRAKEKGLSAPRRQSKSGLVPVYTNINPQEVKYFESILNKVFKLTGTKVIVSQLLRIIIRDFIENKDLDEAYSLVEKNKHSCRVR